MRIESPALHKPVHTEPCAQRHLELQFHQPASAYVEFDFLIARGASIGVYGRKNAVPTLTQNDLREVISGVRARNGRDTANDISGKQVGTCIRIPHSRVDKLTNYQVFE